MTRFSFALLAMLAVAPASRAADRFPFVIPGDDATRSITDLSGLSKPAGSDGFVRIDNGHLAANSGRLKIWGFNLCFAANFPGREDADKVAAHLAKIGCNGVRIHHHDTANSPRGIWGRVIDDKRPLDPQQLERQDYLLDQLNRRGIYINLNLHVGRSYLEEEGYPNIKELPYSTRYAKYILYFEPRMREQFKQFCREYLTHVNPYRRLKRTEDPGIAMIEITNENSFSKFGPAIAASLPEPYRGEFVKQWNQWLRRKYKDDQSLKAAWGKPGEPLVEAIADASAWKDSLGAWKLSQKAAHPVKAHFIDNGPQPGIRAVKFEVSAKSPAVMDQELQYPSLPIEPGKLYTIAFWVRADANRTIYLDVSNAGPNDWGNVGYREVIDATPRWQKIVRVFRSAEKIPGKARICFKFGASDVSFSLADFSMRKGGEWMVTPDGQTIDRGNIEIPAPGWSEAAHADVKQFMVDTEIEFIREMTDFLKKDLGVRVPITASQITYHSPEIVAKTCEYADIHAYWQHPRFPRKPWDSTDWTIPNTPMELAPDGDALLSRTPWRLLDRPFTISEWNIPDPNDYAASVAPFAAMVAALQDWDGVFFFDYQSSDAWYSDKMQGYFSFNSQPAKLALFTACANLYRRGDLAPLDKTAAGTLGQMVPATLALSHRIGIDPRGTAASDVKVADPKRLASPDGQAIWDASNREQAYVMVNTAATRGVWGLVGGRSFNLGKVKISVGDVERRYAAIILTSMDGPGEAGRQGGQGGQAAAIESSKRLLLAAVGSAQNRDMAWNEARTSISNKWGTGPTQVNGIEAKIELPIAGARVYALDGRGQRQGEVEVDRPGSTTVFSIGPAQRTLWYEIEVR